MSSEPSYYQSKLNCSTTQIIHHDKYVEYPFIYVKQYPAIPLAVVIDTGCGAHNAAEGTIEQELKNFIKNEVFSSDKKDQYEFLVVCTHCHFDHIGGIEKFSKEGAGVVASGYNVGFLSPANRDASSLSSAFGLELPDYTITRYATDYERLLHGNTDLGLQIILTPGHTPDSMAIWDEKERTIFTGDTAYQRVVKLPWGEKQDLPIILVSQGSWKEFIQSVKKLQAFVKTNAKSGNGNTIKLAAGHATSNVDAGAFLQSLHDFLQRVVMGFVPIIARIPGDQVAPGGSLGDEIFVFWQEDGNPEFSLIAPERFIQDFEPLGKNDKRQGFEYWKYLML
ncbi:hypothetical protein LTR37_013768 [Vermiconidia calcicola]|uniref:Uncharacterized protein n=1 Tax=Vermiconidia calcicola TaxID=1690605 RepID=A0ACC3MWZ8_9PEZI|nr:hypothetical protein LTR37_013768 [Vermiconidia calcicola]